MALRALTTEERESLRNDPAYQTACEYGVTDYAAYWASNDGSGATTEALRIKWAKDRLLGVDIQIRGLNDSNLVDKCIRVTKNLTIDLNVAPETSTAIIAAMTLGNQFETVASMYFDLKGEDINFTFGGN